MFTTKDIEQAAFERFIGKPNLKHFKAGANASWSKRFVDKYGYHDLDKAESWYSSKHDGIALDAFEAGWSYGANH